VNKTVAAIALVVTIATAAGAFRLLWTPPAPAESRAAPMPVAAEPASRPAEPPAAEAATAAAPAVADTSEHSDEDSPFGHASGQKFKGFQVSTRPAYPEREAAANGASMAPALANVRAELEALLADAGPDAAGQALAFGDANESALAELLTDADPAVREEAAALLKLLGAAGAQ
jgi:hypothetical protein